MSDFTIEQTIPQQLVEDLLDCAWEGGSNYWASADGGSSMAFKPEGVVISDDEDGKTYVLNQKALANGLQVISEKYPRHWANALSGDFDAETGDVFLQCCLLGEIVYG
jgi:hypothetical protein